MSSDQLSECPPADDRVGGDPDERLLAVLRSIARVVGRPDPFDGLGAAAPQGRAAPDRSCAAALLRASLHGGRSR